MDKLGQGKYPFSNARSQTNGNHAQTALAAALNEAEKKAEAVEANEAKGVVGQGVEAVQKAQEIGTGNLDPDNVFSYAVVGNFLKRIADGNRHMLTVADLLTKDKANWDKASYKADKDILISRMTDQDYCLDSLLRNVPLDRLSQLNSRIPPIMAELREQQYQQKLKEITKKVDKHMAGLAQMTDDQAFLKSTRQKMIDDALTKMGLIDAPAQVSNNQAEETNTLEAPAKSSPEPGTVGEAPNTSTKAAPPVLPDAVEPPASAVSTPATSVTPKLPKRPARGAKLPMYARLKPEPEHIWVKSVNYVIRLFGYEVYLAKWNRMSPAVKYVEDVMKMTKESFKREIGDVPYYESRAQSNYLGRVGFNQMLMTEIDRVASK